jgi:hypothetical protein
VAARPGSEREVDEGQREMGSLFERLCVKLDGMTKDSHRTEDRGFDVGKRLDSTILFQRPVLESESPRWLSVTGAWSGKVSQSTGDIGGALIANERVCAGQYRITVPLADGNLPNNFWTDIRSFTTRVAYEGGMDVLKDHAAWDAELHLQYAVIDLYHESHVGEG